jgi:hypothetical protein
VYCCSCLVCIVVSCIVCIVVSCLVYILLVVLCVLLYLSCVYCCSCLVCTVVSCIVCIVVIVLCVLLSSNVYLLYCLCIAVFPLDAGLLARSQYSGRSCDRPPRHRFFSVSLCL